jgi:hypothetical protein
MPLEPTRSIIVVGDDNEPLLELEVEDGKLIARYKEENLDEAAKRLVKAMVNAYDS